MDEYETPPRRIRQWEKETIERIQSELKDQMDKLNEQITPKPFNEDSEFKCRD